VSVAAATKGGAGATQLVAMMLGCVLACPERGDDLVQPVVACWLRWSALVDEKCTARPHDVWSTYYARPKLHAINLKRSSPPHDITIWTRASQQMIPNTSV
jgi:hypothetical protein